MSDLDQKKKNSDLFYKLLTNTASSTVRPYLSDRQWASLRAALKKAADQAAEDIHNGA